MPRLRMLAALLCVAAPAYAQYDRPTECWNPGAGHFEQVRPGEYQNDLDYGRCRVINEYRGERRYYRESPRVYYRNDQPVECWKCTNHVSRTLSLPSPAQPVNSFPCLQRHEPI